VTESGLKLAERLVPAVLSREPPGGALEPAAEPASCIQPDAWLDRVLDQRYRILRLLGEGGMGAVFVAEHLLLRKLVALKIVRTEMKDEGAEVAIRLAREAMATARLEHPHIASAIDYGALPEGGAYFVMQLVRGTSLRRLLSGGRRLPWARALEIAAQVADALSATRGAGITHRDLKPDNILVEVREDGSDLVKVLDFGIAQVAPRNNGATPGAETHRQITISGTVMGTPGYMAPEQAVGDKVDHRADIYALGVVLWECITGRELWVGPDLTTLVSRQMAERVPLLCDQELEPGLPPELDELIQRMTQRLPGARPDNAAEVRDALRSIARPQPLVMSQLRVANASQRRPTGRTRPSQTARRRRRRPPIARRPFWIAAATALVFYFGVREFVPLVRSQVFAAQYAALQTVERLRGESTPAPAPPPEPPPMPELAASFDVSESPPDGALTVTPELPAPIEVAALAPKPVQKARRAPRPVVEAPSLEMAAGATGADSNGAAALESASPEIDGWIAGLAEGASPDAPAAEVPSATTTESPASASAERPAPISP
jgi:serine/threonine protein kinase